jgi:hypothetical protein
MVLSRGGRNQLKPIGGARVSTEPSNEELGIAPPAAGHLSGIIGGAIAGAIFGFLLGLLF